MFIHQVGVHVGVFRRAGHEHGHPVNPVFAVVSGAWYRSLFGVFIAIVVFQHAKVGKFVQQFVKRLVVRRVVFFGIPLVEQLIGSVFADFQASFGQHIQQQIQGGFAGYGIHLIFEDARQAPVFGSIAGHF